MMDTNDLSNKGQICDTAYGIAIDGSEDGGIGMGKHLYILSNEEIKEGDNVDGLWLYSQLCGLVKGKGIVDGYVHHQNGGDNYPFNYKKVIATTNKLPIGNYQGSIEYNGEIVDLNDYLPQIPQSFIEHFIGEYNQGNVINKVSVEVEKIYMGVPIYQEFVGTRIKVNEKNEISIVIEQTETIQEFMDRHAITEQQLMYGYTKGLELMFNELNKS
jgi:hypothetical protein